MSAICRTPRLGRTATMGPWKTGGTLCRRAAGWAGPAVQRGKKGPWHRCYVPGRDPICRFDGANARRWPSQRLQALR